MTTIPATGSGHGRDEHPESEAAAAEILPRLPTPGPAARAILSLFDPEAGPLAPAEHRVLH